MSSIVHTIRLVTSAKDAIAEVGKYQDQIVATAQTVDKYSASLSGNKMLAQANNWTAAIAKLGGATGALASTEQVLAGASKLTAAEKDKVNKVVTTAIEKYTALGQVAPRAMLDLADATKKAEVPTESWSGKLGKAWDTVKGFAGALGIGLGISALVGFAKRAFDTASQIGDLSSKLGTSTEFTQRMSYVANQSGADIDSFGGAISKMNALLAGGEKSTVSALSSAGLSFKSIRTMRPEDAFMAIADAIAKVPDPMLQAELAVKLFGKAGQDLLPAIKDGIRKIGEEAPIMADATVRAMKKAQDSLSRLVTQLDVNVSNSFGATAMAIEELSRGAQGFKNWQQALREGGATSEGFIKALTRIRDAQNVLTEDQKRYIKSQVDAKVPTDQITRSVGVLSEYTLEYIDTLKQASKPNIQTAEEQARLAAETDAHTKAIRELADAMSGAKLQAQVKDLSEAYARLTPAQLKDGEVMQRVALDAAKLRDEGAHLTGTLALLAAAHVKFIPTLDMTGRSFAEARVWATNYGDTIDAVAMETLRNIQISSAGQAHLLVDQGDSWADLSAVIHAHGEQISADAKRITDAQDAATKKLASSVDTLMQSLSQLATIAGDSFDGWVKGASQGIASAKAMVSAVTAAKDAVSAFKSEAVSAGSIALGVFGFIGSKLLGMFAEDKAQEAQTAADWQAMLDHMVVAQKEAYDQMMASLDKYNVAWQDLSATVRDQKIQDAIFALMVDYTNLTTAGVSSSNALKAMASDINDVLIKIGSAGGTITPTLMPLVEQMVNLGLVSADAMRAIMGLTNPQVVDFKAMQTAAEKYGIDLANLGPKFQQAKLDDAFKGLQSDFELLVNNGADMNSVLAGMAPQVNAAVAASQKFGTEIPASMKPMLEAMAKAGDLVDENGTKLNDLSTLKFATPIEDSMKELVQLFKDFIAQIKLSTNYINQIPRDIPVNIDYSETNKPNLGGGGPSANDVDAAARGGLVTARGVQYLAGGGLARDRARVLQFRPRGTDTTPAMLTPGEGVVNLRGMSALGTAGLARLNRGDGVGSAGAPVNVTVVVQAWDGASVDTWLRDGGDRKIARAVLPRIEEAANSYGIKRRA